MANETRQKIYELSRRVGATAKDPDIWEGDRAILHFPDRTDFSPEGIQDAVRYCQERGYSIPALEKTDYTTRDRQKRHFDGYIRIIVDWKETTTQLTGLPPSMIERLLGFLRKRNSYQPAVTREPIESEIYCRPSTMSFDEMHVDNLTPILEELSRILYSGINKE